MKRAIFDSKLAVLAAGGATGSDFTPSKDAQACYSKLQSLKPQQKGSAPTSRVVPPSELIPLLP
jgi:hypothetical protein